MCVCYDCLLLPCPAVEPAYASWANVSRRLSSSSLTQIFIADSHFITSSCLFLSAKSAPAAVPENIFGQPFRNVEEDYEIGELENEHGMMRVTRARAMKAVQTARRLHLAVPSYAVQAVPCGGEFSTCFVAVAITHSQLNDFTQQRWLVFCGAEIAPLGAQQP